MEKTELPKDYIGWLGPYMLHEYGMICIVDGTAIGAVFGENIGHLKTLASLGAAPRAEASQEVKYSDDPEKGVEIARRLLNEELNRMGLGEAESYTVEIMMVIEACVHLADTRQASQDNAPASTDAVELAKKISTTGIGLWELCGAYHDQWRLRIPKLAELIQAGFDKQSSENSNLIRQLREAIHHAKIALPTEDISYPSLCEASVAADMYLRKKNHD